MPHQRAKYGCLRAKIGFFLDGGALSEKVLAIESGRVEQVIEKGKARLMCVAQPNESVRFRLYAPEGVEFKAVCERNG